MIEKFGIGIDIVSIKKFKDKPFDGNERFYKKIFLDNEIVYCLRFKNYAERFAGKFALKEALIKSINEKLEFLEIETSHLDSKPKIKILNSKQDYKHLISLSHENELAVAVVISERIN
tara:strand:- start:186 stop:539 length:354 start_codon:yes stop_codon:yes gene_type:complete